MSQETWAQLPRPTASRPFSWIDWPCLAINAVPRTRISFANAFTSACLVLIKDKTEECQEIWTYRCLMATRRQTWHFQPNNTAASEKPIQTYWTYLIPTVIWALKNVTYVFGGVELEPGKWKITFLFPPNLWTLNMWVTFWGGSTKYKPPKNISYSVYIKKMG